MVAKTCTHIVNRQLSRALVAQQVAGRCVFSIVNPFQSNNEGRVSRGQVSFLLQIPFLPGPSGRKTMHLCHSLE